MTRIGLVPLEGDSVLKIIHPEINEIYKNTILQEYKNSPEQKIEYYSSRFNYFFPEAFSVRQFCTAHNLDGLILGKIVFVRQETPAEFSVEATLKLLNNKGEMVLTTEHNTFWGNTYPFDTSIEPRIHDGIKGAIERMNEEMNKIE